jgi:hypothetical protein
MLGKYVHGFDAENTRTSFPGQDINFWQETDIIEILYLIYCFTQK